MSTILPLLNFWWTTIIAQKDNINKSPLLSDEIKEEKIGLYNPIIYEKFNLNAKRSVENLNTTIKYYLNLDYKIIGFGAAAKGQTLLCYSNIDLEYIIDENPLKINNLSPKLNIPIKSLEDFSSFNFSSFSFSSLSFQLS